MLLLSLYHFNLAVPLTIVEVYSVLVFISGSSCRIQLYLAPICSRSTPWRFCSRVSPANLGNPKNPLVTQHFPHERCDNSIDGQSSIFTSRYHPVGCRINKIPWHRYSQEIFPVYSHFNSHGFPTKSRPNPDHINVHDLLDGLQLRGSGLPGPCRLDISELHLFNRGKESTEGFHATLGLWRLWRFCWSVFCFF